MLTRIARIDANSNTPSAHKKAASVSEGRFAFFLNLIFTDAGSRAAAWARLASVNGITPQTGFGAPN
jgi:hypothetical protein